MLFLGRICETVAPQVAAIARLAPVEKTNPSSIKRFPPAGVSSDSFASPTQSTPSTGAAPSVKARRRTLRARVAGGASGRARCLPSWVGLMKIRIRGGGLTGALRSRKSGDYYTRRLTVDVLSATAGASDSAIPSEIRPADSRDAPQIPRRRRRRSTTKGIVLGTRFDPIIAAAVSARLDLSFSARDSYRETDSRWPEVTRDRDRVAKSRSARGGGREKEKTRVGRSRGLFRSTSPALSKADASFQRVNPT